MTEVWALAQTQEEEEGRLLLLQASRRMARAYDYNTTQGTKT